MDVFFRSSCQDDDPVFLNHAGNNMAAFHYTHFHLASFELSLTFVRLQDLPWHEQGLVRDQNLGRGEKSQSTILRTNPSATFLYHSLRVKLYAIPNAAEKRTREEKTREKEQ